MSQLLTNLKDPHVVCFSKNQIIGFENSSLSLQNTNYRIDAAPDFSLSQIIQAGQITEALSQGSLELDLAEWATKLRSIAAAKF